MRTAFVFLALVAGCLLPSPARAGQPDEVRTVRDIAYYDGKDADPVKHRLDLYLPKGRKGFPVLVFVHGGAWRFGDKKEYAPLGELFARRGIGTVIVNYRLSPKVQHPAHIQDVARAFAWTHARIAEYGGRPDEVFACGHSAGGHLVSLLATDESYLKAEKLSARDIRGVISISGVYLLVPPLFRSVFGKDVETYLTASPMEHISAGRPPFLILYADHDYPTIGGMSERMARALKRVRSTADTMEIEERTHVSIIKRMLDANDPAARAIVDFIGKQCAASPDAPGRK
jgi:acetyl esterase/lipase